MTPPRAFLVTIKTRQARPRLYSTRHRGKLIHPRSLLRKDETGWEARYRLVPRGYVLHADRRAEVIVKSDGSFAVR